MSITIFREHKENNEKLFSSAFEMFRGISDPLIIYQFDNQTHNLQFFQKLVLDS